MFGLVYFLSNHTANNDGPDAFLVMSSAYYDRTYLKSAIDFEQKFTFVCHAPPKPAVMRTNLHETHFLAQFTTLSIKMSSQIF